jgi:multiple sugar transport system substrate-binding protein
MEFLTVDTPEPATLRLQSEMERFGKDKNQPVNLVRFGWDTIWRELVNVGIYRRGPDIAEIGSTWLESLVAMQSLNSFSARDIDQIGGKEIFFPAAWQNVALADQKQIWGIPFRAEARMIFYWKDLFEKASVDTSQAFSTAESMATSFIKLQEMGIPAWVAPTDDHHDTVYNIASWIWGSGGDFLSSDGKRTGFSSPASQRGIRAYFDLLRFMPHQTSSVTYQDTLELFFARKAAAMIGGPWVLNGLRLQDDLAKQLLPHLGVALPPGPSFVGGTLLVLWKHSKHPWEAVELIKRLTSAEFQAEYCQISGLFPVRQDLWTDEFINSDEYFPFFNKAISTGRGLPPAALWGIIEDRLAKTIGAIWQDLYALQVLEKPINTLDEIVARHFESLAARLDMTLSASA